MMARRTVFIGRDWLRQVEEGGSLSRGGRGRSSRIIGAKRLQSARADQLVNSITAVRGCFSGGTKNPVAGDQPPGAENIVWEPPDGGSLAPLGCYIRCDTGEVREDAR